MMIDLSTIQYVHWNERDLEIPAIIDFIKSHPNIKTALDVGAHWSHAYYAPLIRKLLPHYTAIDILPDEQTERIVDRYIIGNVLEKKLTPYDLVFCISSIEHAGITTYKVKDYKTEQLKIFRRIEELSKKYIFITFPFGQEALHEGQFANITLDQLLSFYDLQPKNRKIERYFYFSEAPQQKNPYKEVDIDFASGVEYNPELGTRCVCFLTIEKL